MSINLSASDEEDLEPRQESDMKSMSISFGLDDQLNRCAQKQIDDPEEAFLKQIVSKLECSQVLLDSDDAS